MKNKSICIDSHWLSIPNPKSQTGDAPELEIHFILKSKLNMLSILYSLNYYFKICKSGESQGIIQ